MRKETRRLENEIDVKLVALSKVGFGSSAATSSFTSDTAPLLGESVFDSLVSEITDLLDDVCSPNFFLI